MSKKNDKINYENKKVIEYDKLKDGLKKIVDFEKSRVRIPDFYSVMTSTEMFDRRLTDFEKILIAQIRTLTNKFKVAFPSNNYLSKINNKSIKTISRSINKIELLGYIKCYYIQDKNKKLLIRFIRLCDLTNNALIINNRHIDKKVYKDIDKKVYRNIDKNVKYNNIKELIQENKENTISYEDVNNSVNNIDELDIDEYIKNLKDFLKNKDM